MIRSELDRSSHCRDRPPPSIAQRSLPPHGACEPATAGSDRAAMRNKSKLRVSVVHVEFFSPSRLMQSNIHDGTANTSPPRIADEYGSFFVHSVGTFQTAPNGDAPRAIDFAETCSVCAHFGHSLSRQESATASRAPPNANTHASLRAWRTIDLSHYHRRTLDRVSRSCPS